MKKMLSILLALMMIVGCMACASAEEVKPVILVVSFGTSYDDNRDLSIGAVEADIAAAVPDYEVRRAFTAQTVIDILGDRNDLDIDNVTEALERAVANGVKTLVVQPTHLMHGFEYDELVEALGGYADAFEQIVVSEPLLTSYDDFDRVVDERSRSAAESDEP